MVSGLNQVTWDRLPQCFRDLKPSKVRPLLIPMLPICVTILLTTWGLQLACLKILVYRDISVNSPKNENKYFRTLTLLESQVGFQSTKHFWSIATFSKTTYIDGEKHSWKYTENGSIKLVQRNPSLWKPWDSKVVFEKWGEIYTLDMRLQLTDDARAHGFLYCFCAVLHLCDVRLGVVFWWVMVSSFLTHTHTHTHTHTPLQCI